MYVLPLPTQLEVTVADRVFGGGTIRQKVVPDRIDIGLALPCRVLLHVRAVPYQSNADGAIGGRMPADIPDRPFVLVADNTTLVDPLTGELRFQLIAQSTRHRPGAAYDYRTKQEFALPLQLAGENVWEQFGAGHADALALQGDAFRALMQTPQVIETMITANIRAADLLLHRFA